jgi:hypothetical protein
VDQLAADFFGHVTHVTFPIGDAGLTYLEGSKSIEWINLRNTRVTDAGLEHLEGLIRLYRIVLLETKVTAAGVLKFREAIPKIEVFR